MLVNVDLDKHSVAVYGLLVNVCLTFVCYMVRIIMLLLVSRIGQRRGATRAANKVWRGNEVVPCSFFISFPWKTKAVNLRGLGTKSPFILFRVMLC